MHFFQEAQFFNPHHFVADGGGTQGQSRFLKKRLRTDWLLEFDVMPDN
jgi:hypothetical protein